MQTANIMLSIGGDAGNTVFKSGDPGSPTAVTTAEIAVLRAIHGEDAVHDIEPVGDIDRSNREELNRLRSIYGKARVDDGNGTRVPVVNALYPGAAARVHEKLSELDIPSEFYAARERVKPSDKEGPKSLDDMTKDELLAEAEKRGVEVKTSDKKADIIDAIRDADKGETDAAGDDGALFE